MSKLNFTNPGTVFTLPGFRLRIPVLARPPCSAAIEFERTIHLAAARSASDRAARGVVPVWQSWPCMVIVCQLYAPT